MIKDKGISQLLCLSIYIVSFYIAYIVLPESINFIWLKITIWHVNATILIYLGSVLLKNSSLYDPFWSVAPVPIVLYLSIQSENSILLKMLVVFPILLWAARLTRNWVISWEGFEHEDFRYIDLKNTNKYKAEFNNFFGIHLFPTFIVNICLYPLVYIFINDVDVNIYLYISSIFTFLAVILEAVADEQMQKFRSDPKDTLRIEKGSELATTFNLAYVKCKNIKNIYVFATINSLPKKSELIPLTFWVES